MSDEEERLARPDGHRYDAPESEEERSNKGYALAALAALVILLLVLMSTGTVRVF